MVALHGRTQNARVMRRFSGGALDALAELIGSPLVYLNGYRRAWNDGRRTLVSAAQKRNMDDVAFVRAVVERFGRPPSLSATRTAGSSCIVCCVRLTDSSPAPW